MTCPLNGPRNIAEFACLGEAKQMPDPAATSDAAWANWLYLERNPAGEVLEWWMHTPTNFVFVVRRHTVTDAILDTMTVAEFERRPEARNAARG